MHLEDFIMALYSALAQKGPFLTIGNLASAVPVGFALYLVFGANTVARLIWKSKQE